MIIGTYIVHALVSVWVGRGVGLCACLLCVCMDILAVNELSRLHHFEGGGGGGVCVCVCV